MNLQTGLALLVSAAAGFNEAAADISDFTYMGSPGVCVDSQQRLHNAYGLTLFGSGQVTNQTNDARRAAEWCESAGPLLQTFVGFEFGTFPPPIMIQFACLYSGSLPTPDPNYTPPPNGSENNRLAVGGIAGVAPDGNGGSYSCYRYNGFTTSPTDAPISSPPTKAPVTASPTDAPVSSPPTKAPVTASPTDAPVSSPPTKAPVTVSPTKAPVSSSPTKAPVTASPSSAPVTASPSAAPVTSSPSSAPVTASPSSAPVTSSPSSAPVTSPPTKMPAVSSKSSKISKSLSPNSKSTKNAKKV